MKRSFLIPLLTLLASACAGGGDYGDPCTTNANCLAPLVCPRAGVYRGYCTTECGGSGSTELCQSRHGEQAFCHIDHICVDECSSSRDCSAGMFCDTSGIPDHCETR